MSQRNTIVVHVDSGVWRATLGVDPSRDPSATGRQPDEAVAALAVKLRELGEHTFDVTWQPEPPAVDVSQAPA